MTRTTNLVSGTKERTKDELDELMQFARFGLNDEEQIEGDIIYQIRKWKETKGKIMDLTRAYSAEEVRITPHMILVVILIGVFFRGKSQLLLLIADLRALHAKTEFYVRR